MKSQAGKRMWLFSEMSLPTATLWSDVANWVLVGSLLFGLLSTFAIVKLGNVKEHHWDKARDQLNHDTMQLTVEAERLKGENLALQRGQ